MIFATKVKSWFSRGQTLDCNTLMLQYAKSGDAQLLTQLVDLLADDLYCYLLTLSHKALAEDISQQVWLKVIEKRHMYQHQVSCKAWLFTLARNQLIDILRQQNKLDSSQEIDLLLSDDLAPDIEAMQLQQQVNFEALLEALPFYQREAFVLQQEGFSITDIAKLTQQSPETIKSRLRYARNFFKANKGNIL